MRSGSPLTDKDRQPWLTRINSYAKAQPSSVIIACSALKREYRTWLSQDIESKFFLLDGSFELIMQRMQKREDHFMPPHLLQSQFDALESGPACIHIRIDQSVENITQQIKKTMGKKEIGLIGLGVMGQNLARNIARNGFSISLYNRRVEGAEEEVAAKLVQGYPEFKTALAFEDIAAFMESITVPRKILLMVPAGDAVDQVIAQLQAHCLEGDIIIDGGNSFYKDTSARQVALQKRGIEFVSMGVSGGESGALHGPAIMPSCTDKGYVQIQNILETIAAKNKLGQTCCQRISEGSSGHFVKMIHNGIEYAEMQIIAEVYDILKTTGLENQQIAKVFERWLAAPGYSSYLLEISAKILTTQDEQGYILDRILDKASNKGTGAWTSIAGIQLGIPSNIISSALYARYLSSAKVQREKVSALYGKTKPVLSIDLIDLREAYHAARILNHIQGFTYLQTAAKKYEWKIDYAAIAQIWTGGCIIRSELMIDLVTILQSSDDLMSAQPLVDQITQAHAQLKTVCVQAMQGQVPIPTLSACLNYLHGIQQASSPANLIQAQRDFFGAHTYQLIQDPDGASHHTNWEVS